MSLESSIEMLAKAICELAATYRTESNPTQAVDADKELRGTKQEGEDYPPIGEALKAATPEAVKKPSQPTTPESSRASAQTVESFSPAPTYDDVKKMILAVSGKSRDKAVALLARYGAKSGPSLKEDQYVYFIADAMRVISGAYDPTKGVE